MEKFFSKIRPIAAFIGIGLLGLHLILALVYMIGIGPDAKSVIGFLVEFTLVGALVFAFIMKTFAKKLDQLFNVLFVLLMAYYAVRLTLNGADYFNGLGLQDENGYQFLYGEVVFGILSLVCAVGAMTLFILRFALPAVFEKPLFKLIILALVASVVLFGLLASIFFFIGMGKMYSDSNGNATVWPYVIECIDQNIVLPTAFLFGLFVYEGH